MKLTNVRVNHFKNILDSEDVKIQSDVTCVVGKNESGKTAFLQAVHRLNPVQNVKFDIQRQYPAWLEKQHRRKMKLENQVVVTATFEIDDNSIRLIEAKFGKNALNDRILILAKKYDNSTTYDFRYRESVVVAHIVGDLTVNAYGGIPTTVDALKTLIGTLGTITSEDQAETTKARELSQKLQAGLTKAIGTYKDLDEAFIDLLSNRIPLLFYFDEYGQLPGSVKIHELLSKTKDALTAPEFTARSLLEMAGADNSYLLNPDYETRKRELENVANAITHEVLHYWSTNPELRTDIDITLIRQAIPTGQQEVLDELKIRLYDNRHLLSLPFEERSTGFRWFFSFLAAFSSYEDSKRPVIILLDEPGLGLHARAQADFLRFIDERLSRTCQVIYSTHSPFMVQPKKLERVRLVQDGGREVGSRVTDNVLSTDGDTLFPLQAALGYDLAQHLFVSPNNLVVEGTSDFTYISLMSDHLIDVGRAGLDPRWSIIPVGGADLIPSFVALLGRHLAVSVLVDSRKEGHQRLQQLVQDGILRNTGLITIGEIVGQRVADIEDLFAVDEYLVLFNKAFGRALTALELTGNDPIVRRCARALGAERYDHGKPATVMLRTYPDFLSRLSAATFDRFEALFNKINTTLS